MKLTLFLVAFIQPPADATSRLADTYRNGDAVATIRLYTELLKGRNAVPALRARLSEQEAPPLEEIILQSRLQIVRQKRSDVVPPPGRREWPLLVGPLVDHLTREAAAIAREPLLDGPSEPVADLSQFTNQFWDHYALENRLDQLLQEAIWFARVSKRIPRSSLHGLDESLQRAVTPAEVTRLVKTVKRMASDRREREMELRLARLTLSADVLSRDELDCERIIAAGTWRIDAMRLSDFLERSKPTLTTLREPKLAKRIVATAEDCEQLAGDLSERAETFFEALFWWSRGRYGIGTHQQGLAKHPLMHRDKSLQLQLMMPAQRPKPMPPTKGETKNNTFADESQLQVRRRNQHWWVIGDRQIQESNQALGPPVLARVPRIRQCVM